VVRRFCAVAHAANCAQVNAGFNRIEWAHLLFPIAVG
jgi:hypothetical protein